MQHAYRHESRILNDANWLGWEFQETFMDFSGKGMINDYASHENEL